MSLTRGLSFFEYQALSGVNFSTLKHMASSPLHYKHALDAPNVATDAMEFGSAVHCAVLEPDEFPIRYALWDGGTRRGKEWDAFVDANEGRTVLRECDYLRALAVRDAVRSHPAASDLLRGDSEVTATWTDPETDIECKARLDHINEDCAIDVKTTTSVDPFEFARTVGRMHYHAQLAHYANGAELPRNPHIIAVESQEPFDVVVYRLPDDALSAGRALVSEWLHRVASCRESGRWPGRSAAVQDLTLPPWMLEDDDTGLGFTIGEGK